ncbi:MAG TPA: NUDIX domain-containing protein, partial [Actinomycetales bacterium]|nr:NUDIX domain-containing protein [Actinomycetales bacterium]
GAAREALEETGISLEPGELEGPVAERSAIFDFALRTVRQDELFFVAHVEARELDTSGQTAWEVQLLDEYRWWDLTELEAAPHGEPPGAVGLSPVVAADQQETAAFVEEQDPCAVPEEHPVRTRLPVLPEHRVRIHGGGFRRCVHMGIGRATSRAGVGFV